MELKTPSILICCGNAPNQKGLANKIAEKFNVKGIVIDEHKRTSAKSNKKQLFTILIDRLRFYTIYAAWKEMLSYYNSKFSNWPDVQTLRVPSINNEDVLKFIKSIQPDLIIVSGTDIIKEPLISLPVSIGIINLHTGLSPFVKGGPNCTNWCIANNEWQLVGNTVMWLNAGIDTGNIITTETIDIKNTSRLADAHISVMEHAHNLYIRAISYLFNTTPPYQSVRQQTLGEGKLYLTKMWTKQQRKLLLKNWIRRNRITITEEVKTIPLPYNNA